MLSENTSLTGNDRFEGFCIELIKRLAALAGFHYKIQLSPEAKYGIQDQETGEWNGIIRELIDRVHH